MWLEKGWGVGVRGVRRWRRRWLRRRLPRGGGGVQGVEGSKLSEEDDRALKERRFNAVWSVVIVAVIVVAAVLLWQYSGPPSDDPTPPAVLSLSSTGMSNQTLAPSVSSLSNASSSSSAESSASSSSYSSLSSGYSSLSSSYSAASSSSSLPSLDLCPPLLHVCPCGAVVAVARQPRQGAAPRLIHCQRCVHVAYIGDGVCSHPAIPHLTMHPGARAASIPR